MALAELAEIRKLPNISVISDMPDICKVHACIATSLGIYRVSTTLSSVTSRSPVLIHRYTWSSI